jgi:hypothetical protein
VLEKDVREAAQLLNVRAEFATASRVCQIYAGQGSGATCDACADPVQPGQVEYELNYPDEHRAVRQHLSCVCGKRCA